jgi:hypothetical protein
MADLPRFVVVSLTGEEAVIAVQGTTSEATFREQFLAPYELGGERYHPGEGAVVHGVLVATHAESLVSVPIWTWRGGDGAPRFLCQASDDGRPPAVSVFAAAEAELLSQLERQLRPA